MSFLRAKCPSCRTLTAVAIGPEYECHSCGRTFAAGLVRVPRAWGTDERGQLMIESAALPLDYPGGRPSSRRTRCTRRTFRSPRIFPVRPLILGGCCCSHIGAVEGLAARHERLGIIWFDAHGDLNTPETSPSGNEWGMPLRMIIDGGAVDPHDVALVGARNLDPPEVEYIAAAGIHDDPQAVLDRVDCVYVAIDFESSSRASSRCSCRSRAARAWPMWSGSSAESAKAAPWSGWASPGSRRRRNVEKVERLTTALGF